ncbi:hypothetical protein [Mesorhizobium sp. B1-1-8]|uniref:hypothetical protein n=1 Tax=Mesorhizobium sp. B1-1-8 TaxID=2589976 RepID=UPI0015E44DBA|nr:hypothetical protein [Mesorhizobium sp. B1-1-8]UCI09554.1 hypothetical protein FJ974_11090 [Mesorhizobium sp. B1-1-8]
MAENKQERAERVQAEKDFRVQFLMGETGIAEAQARDLIKMHGDNPNSLLREARLLAKN